MRVFVCGSHAKQKLGDLEKRKLDEIMARNDEILIGDCYGTEKEVQKYLQSLSYQNVRVCVTGESTGNNLIGREGTFVSAVCPKHGDRILASKELEMMRSADYALAIWDGKGCDTWIHMLLLLSMRKRICLLHLPEEKAYDIGSLEKSRPFAGEKSDFTGVSLPDILTECGFCDEMRSYLCERYDSGSPLIAEVICEAPLPVERKIRLLKYLQSYENVLYDFYDVCIREIDEGKFDSDVLYASLEYVQERSYSALVQDCETALGKALEEGKKGRMLYLFNCWYDTDVYLEKRFAVGAFWNLKQIEAYIDAQGNYEKEASSEDSSVTVSESSENFLTGTENEWYEVELWETFDSAYGPYYVETYQYYLVDGKICWFEKMEPRRISDDPDSCGIPYLQDYFPVNRRYSCGSLDLSLETPFHTGDIVKVDCAPFGPGFFAVILESARQYDCCLPNILFRVPGTDRWRIRALKHKDFYYTAEGRYVPLLSPLYRLKRAIPGALCEEREILLTISRRLGGDENLASAVWNKGFCHDDMTWSEVLKLFDDLRGDV